MLTPPSPVNHDHNDDDDDDGDDDDYNDEYNDDYNAYDEEEEKFD